MPGFSVGTAAFSGFSVLARRPWLILVWGAVLLAAMFAALVIFFILALMFGAGQMAEFTASGPAAAAAAPAMVEHLIVPYLVFLLLTLMIGAVFTTAVYRAILDPGHIGPAYLRFGAHELRQMAVVLGIGIPMFIAYVVVTVVFGVIGFLVSKLIGAPLGALVSLAGVVSVLTFLMVRLSLIGPQTFDEGKINLRGSWAMTRGKFWPLLAAYILPLLVIFGVTILIAVVVALVAGSDIGARGLRPGQIDPSALKGAAAGLIGFVLFFYFVVYPVYLAFINALMSAPPASVYKQLAHTGPETVF